MREDWRLRRAVKMSLTVQLVIISLTSSLTDVVAAHQSLHNINFSDAVRSGRRRRSDPVPLTAQQVLDIVERHNEYRVGEGAANMDLMIYDESLAELAVTWAAGCRWKHPNEVTPYYTPPEYIGVGQNLYATDGPIDVNVAIKAWFDEKVDYNYDTMQCSADKMCGHYTQVVWATSHQVGCALHHCTTLQETNMNEANFFVCNYRPGGNYAGKKPYTKGPACSKCDAGAGWCKDWRLCNWQCSSPGTDCSCAAVCYNCATLNDTTCQCSCADGWQGADCSVACQDTHDNCNASPGWPPSWCDDTDKAFVREGCPAMCQLCTPDPNAVASKCPPVYGADFEKDQQTTTDKGDHTDDKEETGKGNLSPTTTFVKNHETTMLLVTITIAVTILG